MEPGNSDCDFCKRLIRLCSGLDYFPADAEVRRLLIERLHVVSANHEHAKAMINAWLTTETAAPKVADLVKLSKAVRRPGDTSLPPGCNACNSGYWVITENGADRCQCARGQALRSITDSARAAARGANA